MENKVVKRVELRNDSFVIFFTDGTTFHFTVESEKIGNTIHPVGIAKVGDKVLWTSRDRFKK